MKYQNSCYVTKQFSALPGHFTSEKIIPVFINGLYGHSGEGQGLLSLRGIEPESLCRPAVIIVLCYMIINIIIINCNWVATRWQWLFYMYTKHEIGYY